MTPTTTHPRPSDEVTAKVVAKWMKWDTAHFCSVDSTFTDKPLIVREELAFIKDPRTSTDAALMLLGHLLLQYAGQDESYEIQVASKIEFVFGVLRYEWDEPVFSTLSRFPISGPEFCHAVVALAAEVLGVEGGE